MPITVQEKAQPELVHVDNPKGITYRLFNCPHCDFQIALRTRTVHKCRKCDTTIPDVVRLMEEFRYKLCYHKGVVNDKGHWDWTKNDNITF